MADDLQTIVVVGASLAGVRAAQALRREGHRGRIVLVGRERHWPPFDRPPLSKQVLTGVWEPDKARLRLPDPFDAEVLLGREATSLDAAGRAVTLDDGTTLAYDALVVATGAAPILLPGTEAIDKVHVLRTIDDCLALRDDLRTARRVAVVGAGVIGCEVASSCRSLGLPVTVVEALDSPLLRVLGPEMGRVATALHQAHGVELRLGTGVLAVEGDGTVERLQLSSGEVLEADVVVVGIGVRPVTAWLDGSGVTVDDGIVCDDRCRAVGAEAGGRVFAAGDVARWMHPLFGRSMRVEHWTNASDQAAHVAKVLVHGAEAAGPFDAVPYFWSDQHGTKFQLVGTSGPGDDVAVVEGDEADGKFVATYTRGGTIVGALCVNWPARTVPWRTVIEARSPVGTTA